MRLIGMGLLAFLLAGIALFLARSDTIDQTLRLIREMRDGPQLQFEVVAAARTEGTAAIVQRVAPEMPIILLGLPAYQGATFLMPIDARPTSGYLQIDVTYQVLAGVEGVLRISIDDTRRAEMLLHPGEAGRSVRIQLTAEDIARARLVVSFGLQGQGPLATCGPDDGVEAVVEIETTSALVLEIAAPLVSPQDRVAAWGGDIRLGWPEAGGADQLDRLIEASRRFGQSPSISFHPDTGDVLSLDEARALAQPAEPSAGGTHVWDEALADRSPLFTLRRFQRSTSWRIRYDLHAVPDAVLPIALDLSIALGRLPLGDQWQIIVTMNDHLLGQTLVDGDLGAFHLSVNLPLSDPVPRNEIEISVQSTGTQDDICGQGPDLVAELLPATRLLPGDAAYGDALVRLRAALARAQSLGVGLQGALGVAEAQVAAGLLAELAPHQTLHPAQNAPHVLVLNRAADLSSLAVQGEAHAWLVYRDADNRVVVEPAAEATGGHIGTVALLVTSDPAAL